MARPFGLGPGNPFRGDSFRKTEEAPVSLGNQVRASQTGAAIAGNFPGTLGLSWTCSFFAIAIVVAPGIAHLRAGPDFVSDSGNTIGR
jgi:hypothetical protein